MKGAGTQAADNMRSAQLEQSAQYGRMAADETNANMLDRLNATLGNIDTVRAAGHDDPTSPTAIALHDRATSLNNQERATRVGNINAQVSQDEASAGYLKSAGSYAYGQGFVGAGADLLGAAGKTNWNTFGFGSSGAPNVPFYAPDDI
jgi:hypothetical protein